MAVEARGSHEVTERVVEKVNTDTEMKEPVQPEERTERREPRRGWREPCCRNTGSSEWQRRKT